MEPIFHIAFAAEWDAATAAGEYAQSTRGKTLAEVGFIHCSYDHQVAGVANFAYSDVTDPLVLLTIDPARLRSPLVVEPGGPGAPDFPHIYGPLHTDAVIAVEPFHVP